MLLSYSCTADDNSYYTTLLEIGAVPVFQQPTFMNMCSWHGPRKSPEWVISGPKRTSASASAPPSITEVGSWNVCFQRNDGTALRDCSGPRTVKC